MPYNTGTTLADLIYQRGQQQAAFLLDRGQRQANAWQQAGGAISGAVDSWRASVENNRRLALEQAREADRQQTAGMQRESAQLTLDEQKHQAKGRKAMRDVLPLAQRQDGVVGYDRTVIQRELEAAGQADLVPQVFQQLDEQDAAHFKVLEARRDAVAGDAFRLLQSGGDERAYNSMIARWEANDSIPVAELDAMREAGKTPEQRQRALLAAVNSSPTFAEQVRKMQTATAPSLKAFKPGDVVVDERNPGAGPLFAVPAEDKTPTGYEAAILAETDPAKRQQLINERQQYAAAGRAPAAPPQPASVQRGPVVDGATGEAIEGYFDPKARTWHRMDGSVIAQPKPASAKEQTSTGAQKRVFQFFQRAQQAENDITPLEDSIAAMNLGQQTWLKMAPNFAQTKEGQLYQQAQRAFTEARLRKDSGAAIPDHEFESDRKTFFAEPGDSPQVLEQKRRARANILSSLAFESGRAVSEFYGEDADPLLSSLRERAGGKAPAAKPGADGWQTIDGIRVRVKP